MSVLTSDQPGINELWLHYLWKDEKFSEIQLHAGNQKKIKILVPGWYNRGWGPDFKDARILVGDDELFGDIEIHIDEIAWEKHGHHWDEAYNKVILHVFLNSSSKKMLNKLGQSLLTLDLNSHYFKAFWESQEAPSKISIKELPGACGLFLDQNNYQKVKSVIFQASEQRLLNKSEHFSPAFGNSSLTELENLLFTSICTSIGYSAFSEAFRQLSLQYRYSEIKKFFRKSHRERRIDILSRWFGFLGILDSFQPEEIVTELRREWNAFRQCWRQIAPEQNNSPDKATYPSRPMNNPFRRLTGLYYHLEKVQFQGLLKSWLKFLQDCGVWLEKNSQGLQKLQKYLDDLFPQPDWDPLNHIIYPNSKRSKQGTLKLIGKQRQNIILVNTVFPFFLSWARYYQDKTLEKTLFALFLVMPGEGRNSKTNFMEQRLTKLHPKFKIKKNLSYYQGLIQLHDDCCRSFYEGCTNCSLVKMIR